MILRATLFLLVGALAAQASDCSEASVSLRGDWGTARFSVEVADDPQERAVGLMHRESLPRSAGMLFVYERPQRLSFWMRNTLIELDMIFVDPQGVVQHVHHRAQPLDETPIFGGDDLTHVLEINGGMAEQLGIAPGSVLRHPSFAAATAAWPC
jgi:uncharacterized membrane protein (UPF0127 family)